MLYVPWVWFWLWFLRKQMPLLQFDKGYCQIDNIHHGLKLIKGIRISLALLQCWRCSRKCNIKGFSLFFCNFSYLRPLSKPVFEWVSRCQEHAWYYLLFSLAVLQEKYAVLYHSLWTRASVLENTGFWLLNSVLTVRSISKYKRVVFTEFLTGWMLWYMLSIFMV